MLTSFIEYHRNKRRFGKMKRRKDFVKRRSIKFFRRFDFRVFQSRIFFLVSFAVKTKKRRHTFLFESYVSLNPYGLTKL